MQDLTQEQTTALALGGQKTCLIAGPGSGKTHTLVARILADTHHHRPEEMVVVTFTNAAAGEIRGRLADKIDPKRFRHIGTLHGWAAKELWKGQTTPPRIATDKEIKAIATGVKATLGAMARSMSVPEMWRNAVEMPAGGYGLAVGRAFRNRMTAAGLTHHDLLLVDFLAGSMLMKTPRKIYVDEYQDSAPIDDKIYHRMWDRGASIYLIGDPRQAIYGFRGATPDNLRSAWRTADAKAQLTRNFRSTPEICHLATRIANLMAPMGDFDPTIRTEAASGPPVAFAEHPGEADEVIAAANWAVEQRRAGATAAILCRYNHQASAIAAALRSRRLAVQCSADPPVVDAAETLSDSAAKIQTACLAGLFPDGPPEGRNQEWLALMTRLGIPFANQAALLPSVSACDGPDAVMGMDSPETVELAPGTAPNTTVCTIHAAKGLEWDAVLLAGADHLALPGHDPEAARLAFVACSRARVSLTVSFARHRTQPESGKALTNLNPTPWIPTA